MTKGRRDRLEQPGQTETGKKVREGREGKVSEPMGLADCRFSQAQKPYANSALLSTTDIINTVCNTRVNETIMVLGTREGEEEEL